MKCINTDYVAPLATYVTQAVVNNGTNASITRSAYFDGAADCARGTCSLWLQMSATSSDTTQYVVAQFSTGNCMLIRRETDSLMTIALENAAGTAVANGKTASAFTNANGWHHLHFVWDYSGTGSVIVTVDGVIETMTWTTNPNTVSATNVGFFTNSTGGIGLTNGAAGGSRVPGCITEFFLDQTYAIPASRFIDGSGKPKDISALGMPIAYFRGPITTFNNNLGTGGNFTATTNMATCTTSPSD